jgi:hypothetical protein
MRNAPFAAQCSDSAWELSPSRPRRNELEPRVSLDSAKITVVFSYEHATGIPAGEGQQYVIRERPGYSGEFEPLVAHHRRQHITRPIPCARRRRDESSYPLVDAEYMAFQRSPVGRASNTGPKFLSNNSAQVFERSPSQVKLLQRLVGDGIAKGPNEKLGVENVFGGCPHSTGSAGTIATPSMARVPRTRARWNTTRSKARSMVSVAVEAPSARCAAWSFAKGKRYVRGTRFSPVRRDRAEDAGPDWRREALVTAIDKVYCQRSISVNTVALSSRSGSNAESLPRKTR